MKPIFVVLKDSSGVTCSEVFASRAGIATGQKVDDVTEGLVWQFSLSPEFGPEDYLVRVVYKGERVHKMETLAGKTPDWASFPDRFREYANDPQVRRSGEEFVCSHLGKTHPNAEQVASGSPEGGDGAYQQDHTDAVLRIAIARDTRVNERKAAWLEVAKLCGIVDEAGIKVVNGTGSKTSVVYMPCRIAQQLSKGRKDKSTHWQSPVPRPEYACPKASNRVLVSPRQR